MREDTVPLKQEVHRTLEAVNKFNIKQNDVKDKLKTDGLTAAAAVADQHEHLINHFENHDGREREH